MVDSKSADRSEPPMPITPKVLNTLRKIGTVKHFVVILALLRVNERETNRNTGAAITREFSAIYGQHYSQNEVEQWLSQLEAAHLITVDRSTAQADGYDNQLTDWGSYLCEVFELESVAVKFAPDQSEQSPPSTAAVLDTITAIGNGKHFVVIFALLRLKKRGTDRKSGAAITRELSRMYDRHYSQSETQQSLKRLKTAHIITADRSAPQSKGYDNQLTEWGNHLCDVFEWDSIAAKVDPNAELPDDVPPVPETGENDGGGG